MGALDDAESLRRLVRGARAIVHCAGVVRGASAQRLRSRQRGWRGAAGARDCAPSVRRRPSCTSRRWPPAIPSSRPTRRASAAASTRSAPRPPGPCCGLRSSTAPVTGSCCRCCAGWRAGSPRWWDRATAASRSSTSTIWPRPWSGSSPMGGDGPRVRAGRRPAGGYAMEDVVAAAPSATAAAASCACPCRRRLLGGLSRLNVLGARLRGRAPMLTPGKVREMFHPEWTATIPRSPTPRAGVRGSGWTKDSGGRSVARRRASASQRVFAHADVPRYPDADL